MNPRTACALPLLLAGAAMGQQVLFLRPQAPRLAAGAPILVRLESPDGPVPWNNDRVRLLLVLGQDTRENIDRAPEAPDAAGAVRLPAPPPGAGAVGLDLAPIIEIIDADKLRGFCVAKSDARLPETVTGKVRVRRMQSCKTLLRVGDAPGHAMAALEETAQQAEIALRMDPTRATVGSDIAFGVSIAGEDVEDARVLATPIATGKTQEVMSREEGAGSFRITTAGPWRVEFHHLVRATAGSGADWILTSGTLTFDVPAPVPEPKR